MHNLPFEYTVRKSKRARHILIHVEMDGRVEVVVPNRVSRREAERFVWTKRAWIERARKRYEQQNKQLPARRLVTGEYLPLFHERILLEVFVERGRVRSFVREHDGVLTVKARDMEEVREKIQDWYIGRSRDFFTAWSIEMAGRLGVRIQQVKVRHMKTQWGSCNAKQAILTYNWKLALGPMIVAQYVVAHEVAHMQQANHSARFWDTVEQLMPDFREHRLWLKRHGHEMVL